MVGRLKMTFIRGWTPLFLLLSTLVSISSALYFSDDNPFLQDFDLPIFYNQNQQNTNKIRNPFTAAYPVVKSVYDVEIMRPIEAMPGKKTVTLYVVPQNALKLHSSSRRFKRANSLSLRFGITPAKYPEYVGLTDGYHIPAVEIPLRKPLVIRNVEVRVSAPAGFMVPYYGDNGYQAYPMSTGCLIAPIPPNTAISPDNPFEIDRLFAVPSLPEYPTYRPAIEQHNHLHIHNGDDADLAETIAQYFPTPEPKPTYAVFELVPVTTEKSKKKKKEKKKKEKKESEEEEEEEEEDKTTTTTTTTTEGTTTTTTTTTTEATTTTTTTEATTTAAASSIQDIIASFSNRRFEQERVSNNNNNNNNRQYNTSPVASSSPFRTNERSSSSSSSDLASRETSYLAQLRQQSLRRQLDQLQKLLSSLNLGSSDRSSELN